MKTIEPWLNFEQVLGQLEHFLSYEVEDDRDRAGVIQAFEFSFEQAWKAIQKYCQGEAIEVRSPRDAFEQSLKLGMVAWNMEPILRSMIDDRNLTLHTYKESTAEEIFSRIRVQYVAALKKILLALQGKGGGKKRRGPKLRP